MKYLAFLTTAVVFGGLIAAHAVAGHGRALVLKPQAAVDASAKKCRRGFSRDRTMRTCAPVKPRGSFRG